MRKALVIAILALFGSETLAQHGFRPTNRPGNPPPFHPTSGRPVLLDSEDNEMFRLERPIGSTPPFNPYGTPPFNPSGPLINRPILTNTFDDVEDNEMFRIERPGGTPPFNPHQGPYINRPTIPRTTFDDVEDNEMFRMERPGGTPPFNPYGPLINRPTPRTTFDDVEDNEMFRMERPGGTPPFNPNQGPYINRPTIPRTTFDDVEDNEMALDLRLPKEPTYRVRFAEDDDEFFGVPMGNGGSGLYASGGSARGGGVAWGAVGQYSHQVGKNTNVFAGAQVSHAPGSKVNIAPHVGVQVRFDDAENDELFAEVPQDDELFAEDDELFGVPMGNGGSGIYASGGSARGGVAWGGVGQYSHPVGKNTNVFVGAQVSHAPGSKVNIAPHAGVQFRFDDEEN